MNSSVLKFVIKNRWMLTVRLIILFAVLYFSSVTRAQSLENAPNTVYVELLGNGVIYSVNYDRLLTESISVRVGMMYYSQAGTNTSLGASILIIPLMANYLIGSGSSKLELGVGLDIFTLTIRREGEFALLLEFAESAELPLTKTALLGAAVIAYRYHPTNPGLNFRIGFTPTVGWNALGAKINFLPWLGLSLGYTF